MGWRTAVIDQRKLSHHVRNPEHVENDGKWIAFEAVGYAVLTPAERLRSAAALVRTIRSSLAHAEPTRTEVTRWGARVLVHMQFTGPNGRSGTLVTVRQYTGPGVAPRLVTPWLQAHR